MVPLSTDDVVVATSGSSQVQLNVSSSAASLTVQSGAIFGMNELSNSRTLTLAGNLVNNGTISLGTSATTSGTAHLIFSGLGRTWTGSGDLSGVKCKLSVSASSSLDISGLTTPLKFRSVGTVPLTVTGTLTTGTQVVNGNGNTALTVALGSASSLVTANPNGIVNGTIGTFNLVDSTKITFAAGSSITFNGTTTQATTGLPASITNLTFNNPAGVNLSATTAVTGTLKLNAQPLGLLALDPSIAPLTAASLNTGGPGNTLNIRSLPPGVVSGTTIPLISYTTLIGTDTDFSLGSLPDGCTGHLAYGTGSISLVLDSLPQSLTWSGSTSGDWDGSSLNWLDGTATDYDAGDFVTFNDSATGATTVNLTTIVSPATLTVNSSTKPYTFSGIGGIGGSASLIKEGSNSLTLANSGTDTFLGAISLNAGTLIYNRPGTTTENHTISGGGALEKDGANTLTLSAANSYTGGTTVKNGTLRLGKATAAGATSGAMLVNSGATLVLSATPIANSTTLSGGSLGGSITTVTLSGALNIPDGTTSTIYTTDPQNTTSLTSLLLTGQLSGSGNINILAGTGSTSPDATTGACRFNAVNDGLYTGTITLGNLVKAEIKTVVADAFSPVGTAKFVLTCGTNDPGQLTGTYCNFLVRNDSGGDATFGNDIELSGTGLATINPLGTSASGTLTRMGRLKIGDGQNLGVYRTSGNLITVVFPTVTLKGGTSTFSPKPSSFLSTVVGSDLSLGDISEASPSNIIMDGMRTLTITGTSSHTGTTRVTNGTLNVTGTLAGTGAVSVSVGKLAGTGSLAGALSVGSGGTIAPGDSLILNSIGILNTAGTTLEGLLEVDVDETGSDLLKVTGTLNLSGAKVRIVGTPTAASYILATATSISGTPVLESAVAGYSLAVQGNSLKLVPASAMTPFDSWATVNHGLTGNPALPGADPDNDGLDNALEFVLGGNPNANDNAAVNPQGSGSGSSLTLGFRRSNASKLQPVAVKVQVSEDLITWNSANDIAIGATSGSGPNGSSYIVSEGADSDAVLVTIPKGNANRKFVRIQATVPQN